MTVLGFNTVSVLAFLVIFFEVRLVQSRCAPGTGTLTFADGSTFLIIGTFSKFYRQYYDLISKFDRSKLVLLLWTIYVISVLFCYAFTHVCLLMPCGHLMGKGLTSWLSFVMSNCDVNSPLVSWVRCGA